jgi:hypothetical protein
MMRSCRVFRAERNQRSIRTSPCRESGGGATPTIPIVMDPTASAINWCPSDAKVIGEVLIVAFS